MGALLLCAVIFIAAQLAKLPWHVYAACRNFLDCISGLWIILHGIDVEWPWLNWTLISFLDMFVLVIEMTSHECYVELAWETIFMAKFMAPAMLILVIAAGVLSLSWLSEIMLSRRKDTEDGRIMRTSNFITKCGFLMIDGKNRGFRMLVLFLTNMHVPLLGALVSSYDCIDSEKGRVLAEDVDITCDSLVQVRTPAVAYVLVMIISVSCYMFGLTTKLSRAGKLHDAEELARFGGIYDSFRDNAVWWATFSYLFKGSRVLVSFASSAVVQAATHTGLTLTYLLLVLYFQPFVTMPFYGFNVRLNCFNFIEQCSQAVQLLNEVWALLVAVGTIKPTFGGGVLLFVMNLFVLGLPCIVVVRELAAKRPNKPQIKRNTAVEIKELQQELENMKKQKDEVKTDELRTAEWDRDMHVKQGKLKALQRKKKVLQGEGVDHVLLKCRSSMAEVELKLAGLHEVKTTSNEKNGIHVMSRARKLSSIASSGRRTTKVHPAKQIPTMPVAVHETFVEDALAVSGALTEIEGILEVQRLIVIGGTDTVSKKHLYDIAKVQSRVDTALSTLRAKVGSHIRHGLSYDFCTLSEDDWRGIFQAWATHVNERGCFGIKSNEVIRKVAECEQAASEMVDWNANSVKIVVECAKEGEELVKILAAEVRILTPTTSDEQVRDIASRLAGQPRDAIITAVNRLISIMSGANVENDLIGAQVQIEIYALLEKLVHDHDYLSSLQECLQTASLIMKKRGIK
jgi:hypothetical protein